MTPSPARTPARRTGWVIGVLVAGTAITGTVATSALGDTDLAGLGGTVFSDVEPGIARLDPDLRAALERAQDDARDAGLDLHVNSGWRSAEHQARLLREAVTTYGSEEEAARWVATPETSPHVAGDAVDVGPPESAAWLGRHGSRYGLCQIYRNEPWHFELRADAVEQGCPTPYDDPTRDPRLQE